MKNILSIIAIAASALACTSCSKDAAVESAAEGKLTLAVEMGQTKAMSETELKNTAKVEIYYADFTGKVREYIYGEMPSVLYLPANTYRVDITAGKVISSELPSWDDKSYRGSKEFTIEAGKDTQVTVAAKISNVVTKISFDESIKTLMQAGYTFKIGTDKDDAQMQLTYDAQKDGALGYFIADGFEPSLYWQFDGVVAKNGAPFTKSGEIPAVEPGKQYTMNLCYTEKSGDLEFTIMVDKATDEYEDGIIFVPVSTGLTATPIAEIWAGHTTLYADVDESEHTDFSKIQFRYALDEEEAQWTVVDAQRKEEGVFIANIKDLTPDTTYKYELFIDEQTIGDARTITTEKAAQVPNHDFEVTSSAESNKFKSWYDPASLLPELQTKWWDSGNVASASYNYVICAPTDDAAEGTTAAVLQSAYAVVKLAAGNLFAGSFAGMDGLNGMVNFGRPFTGRPTGVRFWMKYKGGKVNQAKGHLTTDDFDQCELKFALGTWDYKKFGGTKESPVQVNTSKEATFWDMSSIEGTIAYAGHIQSGNGELEEWKQITLQFDYKDLTTQPTHIILSFAACRYGDYFEGSSTSALYVDNVELLYE